MQKKNVGNFIFLRKKANFRARFRNDQRSVTEPGPTPSPWSSSFLDTAYCLSVLQTGINAQ